MSEFPKRNYAYQAQEKQRPTASHLLKYSDGFFRLRHSLYPQHIYMMSTLSLESSLSSFGSNVWLLLISIHQVSLGMTTPLKQDKGDYQEATEKL